MHAILSRGWDKFRPIRSLRWLILLLLTSLAACRTPEHKQVVWHQRGKTQREIQMDFADCKMRGHSAENPLAPFNAGAAVASAGGYWGYVRDCMESKGYTRCPRDQVPAGESTIR